jgi:4-carboxymuconolactone decarboxylase
MFETPRIAALEAPYPTDVSETLRSMMPPGVPPIALFRTLAKNARVLDKVRLANLLDRGSIERRDREIVILRATARCSAEYEWGIHAVTFATRYGLTAEQVHATTQPGVAEVWSARDALLIRCVDELHDHATLSDALWVELAASYAEDQLIELIVLAGFYHTISFVTNALALPNEPGSPTFSEPRAV